MEPGMASEDESGFDYEELWNNSGFTRNPYDPKPLKVELESRELLANRSKEEQQFKILVSGKEGGIVVVEGPFGVGKTSFVNAMLYDKWNPDRKKSKRGKQVYYYLPSFETIQLRGNLEISDFMLSVLSNCIFSLERIHGAKISESDPRLKAGKELIASTVRSGIGGFSISILGSGGSINKNETYTQPLTTPLYTVMHVMDQWFDAIADKLGYQATIVPINNLDILDDKTIINFLNSARDVILWRHHVWWILMGGPGLFQTLEANAPRVSELITGEPIILEPLDLSQVYQAIDKRIEKFRNQRTVEQPVSKETVRILHEVSKGEVRYVFNRLTSIIYRFRQNFPSENRVPDEVAMKIALALAEQKLERRRLGKREKDVLKLMTFEKTFRIRDYAKFGYNGPQSLQNLVTKFVKAGLIRKVKKSYHEVFYSTSGDVNLLLREDDG